MPQHKSSNDLQKVPGENVLQLLERQRKQKTLRNQQCSPLLRLPGELRNMIYDFAFSGNTVKISFEAVMDTIPSVWLKTNERGPSRTFVERSRRNYRGAFALSYTCRQINHETSGDTIIKNLLVDMTAESFISEAVEYVGPSVWNIRAIRISRDEADRTTEWFLKGATNETGVSCDYGIGVLPSLSYVEIAAYDRCLHHSFAKMQEAICCSFWKKRLEILVRWTPNYKWTRSEDSTLSHHEQLRRSKWVLSKFKRKKVIERSADALRFSI